MSRDICDECREIRAVTYFDIHTMVRVCAHRIPTEVCS